MKVLFVDDEEPLRHAARQTLELAGLDVECFGSARPALAEVSREFAGVLVSDIRLPGEDGIELMRSALLRDGELPVILVTGHGDLELAVAMMREGAYDFIEKPYAPARLVESVRRALDKRALTLENRRLRARIDGAAPDPVLEGLKGGSAAMEALRKRIRAVASTDADVLLVGDTGTGKEVAARALHAASQRCERPLIAINCAALPTDLIESELFGHEAGAFPGASRERYGKFEHARGGTVFLDEIDSLPLHLQAKLLHVVENRSVTRLGSHQPVDLDVRFIAASKSDLEVSAAEGRFRSDLLYRLNVVTLSMPPLSSRREDIPGLFAAFASDTANRYGLAAPEIPVAVLEAMASRNWPGNVRELRNAAERYVLGFEGGDGTSSGGPQALPTLAERLAAHERAIIAACLAANSGSLKDTYEALGISRKALYEKMQRFNLDRDAFLSDQ